jgi:hypothetical protein
MSTAKVQPVTDTVGPDAAGTLAGVWRVERVAGVLPPAGLRKRIGGSSGSVRLGPLPLAVFRVHGRTLDYVGWPIRDELRPDGREAWLGRGLLFGREFCRFRLVRDRE